MSERIQRTIEAMQEWQGRPMKFVELEQNSDEWLMHRMEYCNASEAPIAAGIVPKWYSINTPRKLYEFKKGLWQPPEDKFRDSQQEHGHNMEAAARALAEEELGVALKAVTVVDTVDDIPMSASLDGYGVDPNTGKSYKVEIKCPATGERSATWRHIQEGEIQPYHMMQMDHHEAVCPTDHSYFLVFVDVNAWVMLEVTDDVDPMNAVTVWQNFLDYEPDPEWADLDDEELAYSFTTLKEEIDRKSKTLNDMKSKLIERAKSAGTNLRGHGIEVRQKTRKGSVDYAKVPELKGVDLEPYRKKDSTFWEVRSTGDK